MPKRAITPAPTKEELFKAVIVRSNGRTVETFIEAADRDVLLIQFHGQAMSGLMPAARDALRRCFAELYAVTAE